MVATFARRAQALGLLAFCTLSAPPGHAQGALVVYCGVNEDWCRGAVTAFERATGIKVAMTRKSSGEVYAQIKAEAGNPRADIWWGGTGDPHMQAAEEGLTIEYKSAKLGEQQDWSVRQWEQSKGRAVGIYSGALGFGFNTDLVRKKGLAEPKCWADLLDPKLKDEVQVADPNSSGTSYTLLATVVQLMGEDKGFAYLKALHRNVNQYTKSAPRPPRRWRSARPRSASHSSTTSSRWSSTMRRSRSRRRARGRVSRSARCRSSRARAISTTPRSGTTGR